MKNFAFYCIVVSLGVTSGFYQCDMWQKFGFSLSSCLLFDNSLSNTIYIVFVNRNTEIDAAKM